MIGSLDSNLSAGGKSLYVTCEIVFLWKTSLEFLCFRNLSSVNRHKTINFEWGDGSMYSSNDNTSNITSFYDKKKPEQNSYHMVLVLKYLVLDVEVKVNPDHLHDLPSEHIYGMIYATVMLRQVCGS